MRTRAAGLKPPFEDAVALVERFRIAGQSVTDMEPGKVTTITIHPHAGVAAKVRSEQFNRKEFEIALGPWKVAKLPGFPGPYGDKAFYYLVRVSDDLVIEFYALRTYAEAPKGDTHYDQVIEGVISTLTVLPRTPRNP